jgi:hypothetical protein
MLSVRRGAKAVDFYKSAFGANVVYCLDAPDGAVVARLSADGAEFWVFRRVLGVCLFRDNPLHVPLANHAEQVRAAGEVVHVRNRSRWAREQLPKHRLPLRQGPVPQVAAVQPDEVERI